MSEAIVDAVTEFEGDPQLLAVLRKLPDTAISKVLALKERDYAHSVWYAAKSERYAKHIEDYRERNIELRRHERRRGCEGWDAEDEARLQKLQERVAQARAAADKIQNGHLPPDLPVETVRAFLVGHQRTNYKDARVAVRVARGDEQDALKKAREEVARLERELHAARNSLVPYDDALARAFLDIDALAANGVVDFSRCAKMVPGLHGPHQGRTRWAQTILDTGAQSVEPENGAGLLAWAFNGALKERAKADLDALYKTQPAHASMAERGAAIAEAEAALLAAERREEAIVEVCTERGLNVCRRHNANPLAVLGLVPVKDEVKK